MHVHKLDPKEISLPEGPSQWGEDGIGGNIIRLLESPVIRGKGPRQSDLAQCRHKVGAPEEQEDVVKLEKDEVFVVEGLTAVEGKQALCIWTLNWGIGGVECLRKERIIVGLSKENWNGIFISFWNMSECICLFGLWSFWNHPT